MSQEPYQQYLERFRTTLGVVEVGGFVKHEGQLVQKMTMEEFATQHREYQELNQLYLTAMERGDTINDMVVRLLREYAAKLIEKPPLEL